MPQRELCPCCLKWVTQKQLKKHAAESARRESVRAMGGDPDIPSISFKFKPITGNDIFPPQPPTPTPSPLVNNDILGLDVSVGPSQQPPQLPRSIPLHPIEDNDFPPDDAGPSHEPPQPPKPPDYPSMETSDSDEDNNESEDQDEDETEKSVPHEPNLTNFMDFEFLKQGGSHLL